MTVQFPHREAMDAARRADAREARTRMQGDALAKLRDWMERRPQPSHREDALRAFARALWSLSAEHCGDAFTASLFGRYGGSALSPTEQAAEDTYTEMDRVFGAAGVKKLKVTRLQHFRGGRG